MSAPSLDMQALQNLRSQFSQALKDFANSSTYFRILHTVPPTSPPSSGPVRALYVLDSSFNPPSKAHSSLVKAALKASSQQNAQSIQKLGAKAEISRVLFLLATVNADKKPKPADFEDRLVMMALMAEDLRSAFASTSTSSASTESQTQPPVIDIGITKHPYFIDKARAIDSSGVYTPPTSSDVVEQIHLTGFDTLLRIFAPKYYPSHQPPLSALEPFLSRHRLRATIRIDTTTPSENLQDAQTQSSSGSEVNFSTIEGQKAYLDNIARGAMEKDGLKREWADKVELVVDESGEADNVSSTKAREAVKEGRWDDVVVLVGQRVESYVRGTGLYKF